MAFNQSQLDALESAIAQGVLRVKYADKEVIYQSTEEMLRIRSIMRRELGQVSKSQKIFSKFSKGLWPRR